MLQFMFADERMLNACRGLPVDRPPVWLMRQAGRYLPQYRALRRGRGFLEMCADVERAVEVSLQPVRLVGSEAVVFFCDIFVPVIGMGVPVKFAPGPVLQNPISTRAQVDALSLADPRETVPYVFEILRRLRGELAAPRIPLIGFAGAPFTLACYLAEGGADTQHQFPQLRRMLLHRPELLHALLSRLAENAAAYLRAQVEAGAQVVQLFDTWAGALNEREYRQFALPALKVIMHNLQGQGAPVILYVNNAPHLVNAMLDSGADVISVGANVPLAAAARAAGKRASIQGNMAPELLARPPAEIRTYVRAMALEGRAARGHVINLGHGCLPDTPPAGVRAFTAAVREL